MKRSLWIIPFILAIVGVMAVYASAGQGYTITDIHSQIGSGCDLNKIPDDGISVIKYPSDKSTEAQVGFFVQCCGADCPAMSVSHTGLQCLGASEDASWSRHDADVVFENEYAAPFQDGLATGGTSGSIYHGANVSAPGRAVLFEDDSILPYSAIPAPEFPTIAVPAGLLVGMIYIIFLLKGKGRKDLSYQERVDKSRVKEEFTQ
ncbi:hypothetical protein L1S32_03040 [Methanogenium sp. S4BF]|uniref:hypothetical protein n=1 Tax=Methanogenium sp. S4BF TaxID=1789226 RepID=UPI00241784CC|nr:hypothetical protein [Methanogenium sp. S4BF]WFN35110.1 hypothetical protein L1S32_03040 [Methanogenium sp. S4BF]